MDDGKRTNLEVRSVDHHFDLPVPACGAGYRHVPKKERNARLPKSRPREKEPTVVAESAALIDSFTGEFLYLKNENAIQYPASSTKILTALLVIEAGDLDKLGHG